MKQTKRYFLHLINCFSFISTRECLKSIVWDYFGYTKNDQDVIQIVKEYRVCTAGQRCEIKDFNARREGKDHLRRSSLALAFFPLQTEMK